MIAFFSLLFHQHRRHHVLYARYGWTIFQIIFATIVAVCNCAKLDNTYLPPPDAQNSGGNGLAPPNQSNGNGFNGNNGNGFGQQNPQQGFGGNQPQESQQPPIAILSYENEPNYGDGSYKYSYETGAYNTKNDKMSTALARSHSQFRWFAEHECVRMRFLVYLKWMCFIDDFSFGFLCFSSRKWHQSRGAGRSEEQRHW